MGLMQREKGKRFERDIAARIRERFGCDVRRASQAERADNPDVFVPWCSRPNGFGPHPLCKLWLECQDARNPTPVKKLEQAERDVEAWTKRADGAPSMPKASFPRWPVVIWHQLGDRTTYATMRINTLLDIVQPMPDAESEMRQVVTVELEQFFEMLEAA